MEEAGFTPESLAIESLEVGGIGEEAAGYMMKMDTALGAFDSVILIFARGRINVTLITMGPGGSVHGEDILSLAELMDSRVQENSP